MTDKPDTVALLAEALLTAFNGIWEGFEPYADESWRDLAAAAIATPAFSRLFPTDRAIVAFAKALLAEVPKCTGCDFDHGWDDHVLAIAVAKHIPWYGLAAHKEETP